MKIYNSYPGDYLNLLLENINHIHTSKKKCLYSFTHKTMEKKNLPEGIDTHSQREGIIDNTNSEINDIYGDKLYAISFGVINEMIDSSKPFTKQEAIDKIIGKGGIARIGNGVTIGEYLEGLEEEQGRLWLDPSTGKYQATEKWPKAA